MKRRQLLTGIAGAIAANSLIGRSAVAATVASDIPSPALVNAVGGQHIRVGLSLPLVGVQAEVAKDLQRGYELAAEYAAKRDGLTMSFAIADDGSKPDNVAKNMALFAKDPTIAVASGIVGTPHAKAGLPVALQGGLPVVGIRSGAEELRTAAAGLYHLRASFNDELARMLRYCNGAGVRTLKVIYSDDDFGKASFAFVKDNVEKFGVKLVAGVAAKRNGDDIGDRTADAVGPQSTHADGLLLLLIADPMQRALNQARNVHNYYNPAFCMSFCATREVALKKDRWIGGLAMYSAFPIARQMPGVAMARAFHESAMASKDPDIAVSLSAFEGFFYGTTIARAAVRSRGDTTRAALVDALNRTPPAIDLGGIPVAFDKDRVGYKHLQLAYKGGSKMLFTTV